MRASSEVMLKGVPLMPPGKVHAKGNHPQQTDLVNDIPAGIQAEPEAPWKERQLIPFGSEN